MNGITITLNYSKTYYYSLKRVYLFTICYKYSNFDQGRCIYSNQKVLKEKYWLCDVAKFKTILYL